nr:uncharacterized protein LOC111842646 isoform X1 [Paramormyrops kingsleyae]
MPKAKCINCQIHVPVQLLSLHVKGCPQTVDDSDSVCEVTNDPCEICPICNVPYPLKDLPLHASLCGEGPLGLPDLGMEPCTSSAASAFQSVLPMASPLSPGTDAWKSVQDPQKALQLFLEQLKQEGGRQSSLFLSLDATDNEEERDGALIRFYKEDRERNQWTAPFHCSIKPSPASHYTVWPHVSSANDDSEDDMPEETLTLLSSFLRRFIEQASSESLKNLMRFWVGWEVPPQHLKLEVVQSRGPNHLPTAATCSERLRLPNHYRKFEELRADLTVCLLSVDTGFGLV